MTSSAFVWAYLPGDTEPTLCGRFTHERVAGGKPVGSFVYGKSYLARADRLPIDPVLLPLAERRYDTTDQEGTFGVLADAVPDDWGRFVIDRQFGQQVFPIGYLLHSTNDRVGNLAFTDSPDARPNDTRLASLEILEPASRLIAGLEAGRPVSPELEQWVRPNTGLGGARPKLTIEFEGSQWLAKFPSRRDDSQIPDAPLELATLALAARCGIRTASARIVQIGDSPVLLVKRFDRSRTGASAASGWLRHAFLSARTVFYSQPHVQAYSYSGSYPRLARELSRWSADPAADRLELFRRMAFNCAVSNTDDHDRNHGFVADDDPGSLRLSPAYDLVPRQHHTQRRLQAMIVGDAGAQASLENLVSDCEAFGLDPLTATDVALEIEQLVLDHWRECCTQAGLSEQAIERLATRFTGFVDGGAERSADVSADTPRAG